MIGDLKTAALIDSSGNLAWLCWPDFDSEACFASLIGTEQNGVWTLAPLSFRSSSRRYLPNTLVLETTYVQSSKATVTVTDFMARGSEHSTIVRIVRGVRGSARMRTCFAPRLDYGSVQPRLERGTGTVWNAISGPHRLTLRSDPLLSVQNGNLQAEWIVKPDETYSFVLQHSTSYSEATPLLIDPKRAEEQTAARWSNWIGKSNYRGPHRKPVERSLITLKALTYDRSGGFVAAPTTSLPEKVGGVRNWDYRFCWLRDTTFILLGLLHCGFEEDVRAWLQWLSRSIQGDPSTLKVFYGITGKREHSEWQASWLSGYRRSRPVSIGNKASDQFQLGVFGELMDALFRARQHGLYPLDDQSGVGLEFPLLKHLEDVWVQPDQGMWEMRSPAQHFTGSKVMAWVAFDRGIRMVEQFGLQGPVERWRKIRSRIHKDICMRGFHRGLNSFTQAYGNQHMDGSLLLLPLVGFLPIDDPRIEGTIARIEKQLLRDGLLLRYDTSRVKDGFPVGEGAFLACNFWLVDIYVLQGRRREAQEHFERLLALSNDVGLLSEEFDRKHGLIGNFPQAFSHIGLLHAALALKLGTSVRLQGLDGTKSREKPSESKSRRNVRMRDVHPLAIDGPLTMSKQIRNGKMR